MLKSDVDAPVPQSRTLRITVIHKVTVWLMLLLIISSSAVQAQETVKTPYTYTFGQLATFSLALSPGADTAEATLYVTVNNEYTKSYQVQIENNQAHYQRDLREDPFPPFAAITYWWQFKDSQGQDQKTAEINFLYEDNRFRWQILEKGAVTLHWVSGDSTLMVNALDTALASLNEIQDTLQATDVEAVTFYIYPSLPDLQSALRLAGRDWVGGQAYPEIGVILVAIAPTSDAILKINQYIPHELTHKILYDSTGAQGYESLPVWLVEGLASHFELSPDPEYALALENAIPQNDLIPLEALCYPFPEDRENAILAYAQSQSIVKYLEQTQGWTRIRLLIDAYADGLSCSAGARRALEMDLSALERDWQVWLEQGDISSDEPEYIWNNLALLLRDLAPWLMLIAIIFFPAALLTLQTRFGV